MRRFNAPQRPSQPPQRDHLLFLFLVQDIAHVDEGYPRVRINVLDRLTVAGFQVIIIGRVWVITEDYVANSVEFSMRHHAPEISISPTLSHLPQPISSPATYRCYELIESFARPASIRSRRFTDEARSLPVSRNTLNQPSR